MNISKNIISIRESKGIKQSEIAQMLDIEQSNYSRLEKRGHKLTLEQIEKIADALKVTVAEILGISTDLKNTSIEVEQLKKRNEELEDTLSDKKYIISDLHYFIEKIKNDLTESLGLSVLGIAQDNNLVKVRLYNSTDVFVKELQFNDFKQDREDLKTKGYKEYSYFIDPEYYENMYELVHTNHVDIIFQTLGFVNEWKDYKEDKIRKQFYPVIDWVNDGEKYLI